MYSVGPHGTHLLEFQPEQSQRGESATAPQKAWQGGFKLGGVPPLYVGGERAADGVNKGVADWAADEVVYSVDGGPAPEGEGHGRAAGAGGRGGAVETRGGGKGVAGKRINGVRPRLAKQIKG
jgi:hypothetical protein